MIPTRRAPEVHPATKPEPPSRRLPRLTAARAAAGGGRRARSGVCRNNTRGGGAAVMLPGRWGAAAARGTTWQGSMRKTPPHLLINDGCGRQEADSDSSVRLVRRQGGHNSGHDRLRDDSRQHLRGGRGGRGLLRGGPSSSGLGRSGERRRWRREREAGDRYCNLRDRLRQRGHGDLTRADSCGSHLRGEKTGGLSCVARLVYHTSGPAAAGRRRRGKEHAAARTSSSKICTRAAMTLASSAAAPPDGGGGEGGELLLPPPPAAAGGWGGGAGGDGPRGAVAAARTALSRLAAAWASAKAAAPSPKPETLYLRLIVSTAAGGGGEGEGCWGGGKTKKPGSGGGGCAGGWTVTVTRLSATSRTLAIAASSAGARAATVGGGGEPLPPGVEAVTLSVPTTAASIEATITLASSVMLAAGCDGVRESRGLVRKREEVSLRRGSGGRWPRADDDAAASGATNSADLRCSPATRPPRGWRAESQ